MRGLMVDTSSLAEEHDHPFDNGKDGPRIAKIWDAACLYDVDSQRRLGVECLCFGIFERADWDVPLEKEEHTMQGLLHEPIGTAGDGEEQMWRRVGFLIGKRPDGNVKDMSWSTVTIV
jgi:hypothetical protein